MISKILILIALIILNCNCKIKIMKLSLLNEIKNNYFKNY